MARIVFFQIHVARKSPVKWTMVFPENALIQLLAKRPENGINLQFFKLAVQLWDGYDYKKLKGIRRNTFEACFMKITIMVTSKNKLIGGI